ncbi:MAG: hypothetical protein KBT11_00090, partial [Treponema sp.]|nr:hypothetical protein [Candidatus Treponema equifaecale]
MKKLFLFLVLFFNLFITSFAQELDKYDYIICNRNSDSYNFFLACINNDLDYINKQIEKGFNVDCELNLDEDHKIAKVILEKTDKYVGSKEQFIDDWHGSPIFVATYVKNIDVIKLLTENGANINAISNYGTGKTLLELAIENDDFELFIYFIEKGLDPFEKTNN